MRGDLACKLSAGSAEPTSSPQSISLMSVMDLRLASDRRTGHMPAFSKQHGFSLPLSSMHEGLLQGLCPHES
ncbi:MULTISPECIES: hypothetical protein [unclassified Pseudovibrio]|uniref:hypothetical protein n=1 Tax=unclassified Pseudovibrio TaxID=2627060 RepID=UPI0007AE39AB|nr:MULTISPECIES: hypothetical protein [unclassified Pseudovibrio]